jgi:hypothetical protein
VGDILVYVKVGLAERGKRLRDLAEAIGEDYARLCKYTNGYAHAPADLDRRVREAFARWDAERTGAGRSA